LRTISAGCSACFRGSPRPAAGCCSPAATGMARRAANRAANRSTAPVWTRRNTPPCWTRTGSIFSIMSQTTRNAGTQALHSRAAAASLSRHKNTGGRIAMTTRTAIGFATASAALSLGGAALAQDTIAPVRLDPDAVAGVNLTAIPPDAYQDILVAGELNMRVA